MQKMHKLKDITRRGTALVVAASFLGGVGSSVLPSLASADSLNPLTERSLTLSSASPGWSFTDGSNNSTYAPPNSGANGKKTGETFQFRASSDAGVKAFSFQYCTQPAGYCQAPGDDSGNALNSTPDRGDDTASTSDLNVVYAGGSDQDGVAPTEATYSTIQSNANKIPKADGSQGNYVVLTSSDGSSWTQDTGWDMYTKNQEESTTTQTGKNNYIVLTNTSALTLSNGEYVKIVFYGTDDNYITNPGSEAFFAKINDYSDVTTAGTPIDAGPPIVKAVPPVLSSSDIVDGGVTVANVMNESIAISTKVLETMDFSVGTVDPDTLSNTELSAATDGNRTAHGQCDPVLPVLTYGDPHNILTMGDPNTQDQNSTKTTYALSTAKTYATHSYFRLSSNSSGGATVYYSGATLSNTEGDQINPIGTTAAAPSTGTEQFGIALDNGTSGSYAVDYQVPTTGTPTDYGTPTAGTLASDSSEFGIDTSQLISNANDETNGNQNWLSPDWNATRSADPDYVDNAHNPQLAPLQPEPAYSGGGGAINGSVASSFAFDPLANTVPAAIASENNEVVDCVTGKVRYIGNIAATTPAGVYTTKINYIASPQY